MRHLVAWGTTYRRAVTAMVAGLCVSAGAFAVTGDRALAEKATGAFNAEQKADIEKIVRSYLLANPEIFLEVQTVLEKRMQEEQERRLKNAVSENAQSLFKRANAPIAGNPDG
ncbi:MAG: hypothetical protein AAFO75_14050, partial [Pseudomonadota bacterium]